MKNLSLTLTILTLTLLACRGGDAESNAKTEVKASTQRNEGKGSAVTHQPSDTASKGGARQVLLKWRVDRWSIGETETMDKPGTVACEITADKVVKIDGALKLTELQKAIAVLYPLRNERRNNPIFRGLDQSRELMASAPVGGEEFLVQKMFQSLEVILPQSAAGQEAAQFIQNLAVRAEYCPVLPR